MDKAVTKEDLTSFKAELKKEMVEEVKKEVKAEVKKEMKKAVEKAKEFVAKRAKGETPGPLMPPPPADPHDTPAVIPDSPDGQPARRLIMNASMMPTEYRDDYE